MTPHPMNLWLNWSLAAVMGNLQEADALMREYGHLIEKAAAVIRRRNAEVLVGTLYRGIVIPESDLKSGKLPRMEGYMSTSFTERLEVACWFANTEAGISQVVMQEKPSAKGFIAEYEPVPEEILFHHAWDIVQHLPEMAAMHPNIPDADQFEWYLRTQEEVITLPPEMLFVNPVEDYGCPPAKDLDDLFHPPSVKRPNPGKRKNPDIDLNGVFFHGTRAPTIKQLKPSQSGEFGPGIYLTGNENTAWFYAKNVAGGSAEPRVLQVRVYANNPFVVKKVDWLRMTERSTPRAVQNRLKEKGYDSIVGVSLNDYEYQVVVFDPADVEILRSS